jgi:hypothetical protein
MIEQISRFSQAAEKRRASTDKGALVERLRHLGDAETVAIAPVTATDLRLTLLDLIGFKFSDGSVFAVAATDAESIATALEQDRVKLRLVKLLRKVARKHVVFS